MSAADEAKEAKTTKGWGGAPPPWLATLQKKIDDRKEAEKKEGEEAATAGSESQDPEEKGRFSDGEERQHPLQVRRKKKADGSESGATDTHTTPRSQPPAAGAAAASSTPQRSEHTQEANPELEAEGDVHAVMQNHTELARYHHQAMAHHFAMMYHHSNLAAEAYAHYMGPDHDIRQYRPDIPEMPILPDDYHMTAESQHEGPAAYGGYNERGAAAAHAAAGGEVHHEVHHKGAHAEHYYATEEEAYYYSEYGHETHETFEVPIEEDPQLTHEEQSWLNNQISDALQDHVESELKVEEELMEGIMPEMVCVNEDNPTAEEVDRFMKEVEVIEAWNKPISSVYVKEEKDADAAKKPDAEKAEKAKE